MDEKKAIQTGTRSGIGAAAAVLFIGLILVLGVLIVFSAYEINNVTALTADENITQAAEAYSSINPVGRFVFKKKTEKAFLEIYNEYLEKGYIDSACKTTELLDELFSDFDARNYLQKLAECASKALWNGDCKAACKAAEYISEKSPDFDLSILRSGLESSLETSASHYDFDSVDSILKSLASPDMSRLTAGLAKAAYNSVFSGSAPDYSPSVKEELNSCLDAYDRYNLSETEGGKALYDFVTYYLAGCERFGKYFEVFKLSQAVRANLDAAKINFSSSLNSEDPATSHTYAKAAYDYACKAAAGAEKFDSNQLGVTEYKALCSEYAANAQSMSVWETSVDFSGCSRKETELDSLLKTYTNEIENNISGFEDYSDPFINNSIKSVFA